MIHAMWLVEVIWVILKMVNSSCRERLSKLLVIILSDMPKATIKASTFCCGGGGGLLTDDLIELRIKGAMPRMQALKTKSRK